MPRTRVKICGISRPQDAALASAAGADAVGMVFVPAAFRNCPADVAQQIVDALPSFVTPVGLFVDAPVATIREMARSLPFATWPSHCASAPSNSTVRNRPKPSPSFRSSMSSR